MIEASQTPKRLKSGKGGVSLMLGRQFSFHGFGLLMTLFVFGVLPGLQIVTGGGGKKELVRSVTAITEAPPPQESLLEDKPPPPPEPEEPPPPMEMPQTSLADISGALNPSGSGAAVLNNAMSSAAMNQGMSAFSMGDEVKPRPVSTVQPRVPANLRKAGLRGTVKVQFVVDANGRVQNPSVVSTPNPALNQPTLEAIKQWRFEPGTRGGKRVPMKTMQPFNYGG